MAIVIEHGKRTFPIHRNVLDSKQCGIRQMEPLGETRPERGTTGSSYRDTCRGIYQDTINHPSVAAS